MEEAKRDETTGPVTTSHVDVASGEAAAELRELAVAVDADGSGASDVTTSQADELEHAIQEFLADMGSGVVSVSRVVNPLLQVWSVARDVDAEVAVPVENLLTVLVGRSLTTSQELEDTMTEVRAMLAGAGPLASV